MLTISPGQSPERNNIAHTLGGYTNIDRCANAKRFAEEGFGIVLLKPSEKKPMWNGGYQDAVSDPATINTWFEDFPDCNYGVVLPPGIIGVDVDPKNGGDHSLAKLEADIGQLTPTLTTATGGGGTHRYYRLPAEAASARMPGILRGYVGIEIRSSKGHLVGPGSIHPNGTPYTFDDGLGIDDIAIATAPAALVALLTKADTGGVATSVPASLPWKLVRSANAETLADFDSILAGCAWAQRFVQVPKDVLEPEWVLFAMLTSHCSGGHQVFHEVSKLDPARYDYGDAEVKYEHVLRSEHKPPRCSTIHDQHGVEECSRCPFFGTISSPIKLGYASTDVIELQRTHIYASASERYFNIAAKPFATLTTKGFSDTFAHLKLDKSPHDVLKASDRTVKVHNVRYAPGNNALIINEGGLRYLNSYGDTGCAAEPGSCDRILDHLAHLVPDEAERNHILNGFASLVQNPSRKIRHIWVIIGGQGTGKGFFTHISRLLFGKENVGEAAARDLNARFKGHLVDLQVLILGEMMSGDRRDTYNENKELFSEDAISIEDKGLPFRIANTPRLIVGTSNHDRPVSGEKKGERRLFVVKSPAEVLDPEYYKELYEDILPSEAPAFKDMLAKRDLSAFSPDAPPPMTAAKEQVLFESMSQLAQTFADAIEAQDKGFEKDLVNLEALIARHSFGFGSGMKRYTVNEVRNALNELGAQRFNNNNPVSLDINTKKRFWVIRNFEQWKHASSEDARLHLNG